ncbi:MAG: DUF3276 family protein [Bacteroidales bacterium]|nr:DUF3276 family protein [Bacteroidales bacterium]
MYREDFDRSGDRERSGEDVFSKPVRAGKRTYFFDVKSTKGGDDFYLTITESKRRQERDGSFTFDKHKIFLYKEDFDKFQEGLADVIGYIREKCLGEGGAPQPGGGDVDFDEL